GRRGDARLAVFVVRVTRRAARLLHLIVDHRDDRMVGDAALPRTVVVQNVTKPKPALLHQTPPEPYLFRRDRFKKAAVNQSLQGKSQNPNPKSEISTAPFSC